MIAQYRALWRNRPFRWLWSGYTISATGDFFTKVALTWLVLERTHSPEALGLLTVCYIGPVIVGGLIAGWALDRFGRRRVMIIDCIARGSIIALLPILSWMDALALWHVYAAAAFYGFLMMVSLAGMPSMIPALVRTEELNAANALEMLSYTLAGILGPAAAGALIAWQGVTLAIAIDVASYALFALALWRMGSLPGESLRRARPPEGEGHEAPATGIGPAFNAIVRHPALLATTLMYMSASVGEGLMSVWLPLTIDSLPGGGPALYGALLGVVALGECASLLLVGALGHWRPGLKIALTQLVCGLSLTLILLAPGAIGIGLAMFLFGLANAPLTVWAQSLRMAIIPKDMHGRAFALIRMTIQSGNPLGGALGGLAVPALGLAAGALLSAALIGLPGLIGLGLASLRKVEMPKA
jgi:MFS family permease